MQFAHVIHSQQQQLRQQKKDPKNRRWLSHLRFFLTSVSSSNTDRPRKSNANLASNSVTAKQLLLYWLVCGIDFTSASFFWFGRKNVVVIFPWRIYQLSSRYG